MLKKITTAALAAAAITVMATSANAAFTNGNFAFSAATNSTADILTTTSFSNDATGQNITVTSVPGTSTTNNFVGQLAIGNTLSLGTTFNFATGTGFNFSSAALGTFVETSVQLLSSTSTGSGSTRNASVSYEVFGTFTPGTDFPGSSPLTADETFALTQTGAPGTASVSIGGTFNSPAAVLIPEPVTISLFGAGLAGIGFGARRRKKAPTA